VRVWCGFPSGSFTVALQLGEDVPPADLVHELGEVAGGVEVAIEHEVALVAPVGPFG
jgi:hypothetical protein